MEGSIANFCFNCGKGIPEKAKYCPFCGEHIAIAGSSDSSSKVETGKPKREARPVTPQTQEAIDGNVTLLDPGETFRGYTIVKMMNKDSEGIKYIAEKDDKKHVLKVFYKSSFHNMNTLFGLQMRLSRLNNLKDSYTAKVAEVNQSHSPAYMATEYVQGISLADLKKTDPGTLTEALVRNIAVKLIQTAITVRNHGLTLANLSLTGIMLDDKGEPVVLSSGIAYEDVDEREDVFSLGVILAQLLSQSAMYKNTYSAERLKANKFTYISGTTISFNKILAESLHRNILQRYRDLHTLRDAIVNLPPIANDEICDVLEKPIIDGVNPVEDEIAPKVRIEYGFWLLVILVIALIVMLFTTNIYTVLFGVKKEKLQYTGFTFGTTEDDSTRVHGTHESFMRREAPMSTEYGTLKRDAREEDSRRLPPAPMNNATASTPSVAKNKPSSAFVYIEPGTLGFGRLGENLAHNVSLSGFYICKYELTQGEWNRYMKPANVTQVGDNLPVDNVSWYDIAIYCNGRSEAEGLNPAYKIRGVGAARVISCNFAANGYRLPTEAEWEIAAKAGQIYNYSGSNDPDEVAWYRDNSAGKIRNPASKVANDFGIYDMTGNVSEWVWDWYDANFLRALPTFINPTGPQAGTLKTIRGGSVMNGEGRNLNILWREKGDPNKGYQFIGFRLVRSN